MIQFNLLPEVKIKYIKARRQKRMVMLIASLVSVGSLTVLSLMLGYVYLVQGAQISSLNNKIAKSSESIKDKKGQVDDINKVLTVQNQLRSLDTLHEEKPIVSRTFDYLTKLMPSQVTISTLTVDTSEGAELITIEGSTDTLESVNRFIDTLKFTKFKTTDEDSESLIIFTEVVLDSFARDKAGADYTVKFKYDPAIFKSSELVTGLSVPTGFITTRSELGRPILQTDSEQVNNAPAPIEEKK